MCQTSPGEELNGAESEEWKVLVVSHMGEEFSHSPDGASGGASGCHRQGAGGPEGI